MRRFFECALPILLMAFVCVSIIACGKDDDEGNVPVMQDGNNNGDGVKSSGSTDDNKSSTTDNDDSGVTNDDNSGVTDNDDSGVTNDDDSGSTDDDGSGSTDDDGSDENIGNDNGSDNDTGGRETPNFYNGKCFKYEWVKVANNHLCSYNIYFLDNNTVKVTSIGEGVLITEQVGTYKIVNGEIEFTVNKVVISPWRVKLLSATYSNNQLYVKSKDERIYDHELKTSYRYFNYNGTITSNN